MKTSLRHVKIIVIDEVSMISSLNLAYMHLRLEELFGSVEWFGSKNMLFVGDLLQLQPPSGNPIFEKISKKALLQQLGCAASVNIWKDSIVYDELTINERQKKDEEFSSMLDCVRRGCPTDETLRILQQRVIQVSASEKFDELQKSGQTPVCLFPKRKACNKFNNEMLRRLSSKVHEIVCTDEVDETAGTRKWNKKAAERLQELNEDCNLTAGLEAKLSLAVGARVMLRRNIDTRSGLVNGAIGTILSITGLHVTVQFDHISEPYNVEMVKSRFMVMKNFYVYKKQFPLILAYGVTIHKSQGLSLDCAIIELSDEVFSDGMAYVALSRVRSLSGLYLTAFDPKCIKVSLKCLREVNRLRATYRPDLPLYAVPIEPKTGTKRKLTGTTQYDQPKVKRRKGNLDTPSKTVSGKRKRPRSSKLEDEKPAKKACSGKDYDPRDLQVWPFSFYPVDEQWQRNACAIMGLQFRRKNSMTPGGPDVALTPPDQVTRIMPDGNCLFQSFSQQKNLIKNT